MAIARPAIVPPAEGHWFREVHSEDNRLDAMSNIGFVPVALEADQHESAIFGGVMIAFECVTYLDHCLLLWMLRPRCHQFWGDPDFDHLILRHRLGVNWGGSHF